MNWNPAKKAQMLLLEPNVECYEQKALGTGIIPIAGSARAGKSTLMLALVEWAVKHTQRSWIDGLNSIENNKITSRGNAANSRCFSFRIKLVNHVV